MSLESIHSANSSVDQCRILLDGLPPGSPLLGASHTSIGDSEPTTTPRCHSPPATHHRSALLKGIGNDGRNTTHAAGADSSDGVGGGEFSPGIGAVLDPVLAHWSQHQNTSHSIWGGTVPTSTSGGALSSSATLNDNNASNLPLSRFSSFDSGHPASPPNGHSTNMSAAARQPTHQQRNAMLQLLSSSISPPLPQSSTTTTPTAVAASVNAPSSIFMDPHAGAFDGTQTSLHQQQQLYEHLLQQQQQLQNQQQIPNHHISTTNSTSTSSNQHTTGGTTDFSTGGGSISAAVAAAQYLTLQQHLQHQQAMGRHWLPITATTAAGATAQQQQQLQQQTFQAFSSQLHQHQQHLPPQPLLQLHYPPSLTASPHSHTQPSYLGGGGNNNNNNNRGNGAHSPLSQSRRSLGADSQGGGGGSGTPHSQQHQQQQQQLSSSQQRVMQQQQAAAAAQGLLIVVDPTRPKLRVPRTAIHPTKALTREGGVNPSLCMLFLTGRCRQEANCHQVHADPSVIERLREEAANQLTCCSVHGDCNHGLRDPQWPPINFHIQNVLVPIQRIAYTAGLKRYVDEAIAQHHAALIFQSVVSSSSSSSHHLLNGGGGAGASSMHGVGGTVVGGGATITIGGKPLPMQSLTDLAALSINSGGASTTSNYSYAPLDGGAGGGAPSSYHHHVAAGPMGGSLSFGPPGRVELEPSATIEGDTSQPSGAVLLQLNSNHDDLTQQQEGGEGSCYDDNNPHSSSTGLVQLVTQHERSLPTATSVPPSTITAGPPVAIMGVATALPPQQAPSPGIVSQVQIANVCNLHIDKCRYGEDCKFLHVCRDVVKHELLALMPASSPVVNPANNNAMTSSAHGSPSNSRSATAMGHHSASQSVGDSSTTASPIPYRTTTTSSSSHNASPIHFAAGSSFTHMNPLQQPSLHGNANNNNQSNNNFRTPMLSSTSSSVVLPPGSPMTQQQQMFVTQTDGQGNTVLVPVMFLTPQQQQQQQAAMSSYYAAQSLSSTPSLQGLSSLPTMSTTASPPPQHRVGGGGGGGVGITAATSNPSSTVHSTHPSASATPHGSPHQRSLQGGHPLHSNSNPQQLQQHQQQQRSAAVGGGFSSTQTSEYGSWENSPHYTHRSAAHNSAGTISGRGGGGSVPHHYQPLLMHSPGNELSNNNSAFSPALSACSAPSPLTSLAAAYSQPHHAPVPLHMQSLLQLHLQQQQQQQQSHPATTVGRPHASSLPPQPSNPLQQQQQQHPHIASGTNTGIITNVPSLAQLQQQQQQQMMINGSNSFAVGGSFAASNNNSIAFSTSSNSFALPPPAGGSFFGSGASSSQQPQPPMYPSSAYPSIPLSMVRPPSHSSSYTASPAAASPRDRGFSHIIQHQRVPTAAPATPSTAVGPDELDPSWIERIIDE